MKPFHLLSRTPGVACVLLAVLLCAEGSRADDKLWSAAPAPLAVALPDFAKRVLPVSLNWELVERLNQPGPQVVRLPLFDDEFYDLEVERMASFKADGFVLSGRVKGEAASSLSFARVQEAVVLDVKSPGRNTVRLETRPGGLALLSELDPDKLGVCGVSDDHEDCDGGHDTGLMPFFQPNLALRYVDLLALYTPTARIAAGGLPFFIEAAILGRWGWANTALRDSGSGLQIRLLAMLEFNLSEAGQDLGTLLTHIANSPDVASLRTQYGADLVHLFPTVQGNGGNASVVGVAHRPGVHGVTKYNADITVFAHETGHNYGCRHQLANDPGGTIEHAWEVNYTFSAFESRRAQTVMWATVSSDTVQRFSNPNASVIFEHAILPNSPPLPLGNASYANNAGYIWNNRLSTVQRLPPKFYVQPGANGDASPRWRSGSVAEIYNGWLIVTAPPQGHQSEVWVEAGTYNGVSRLATPSRIAKSGGTGNVRLTP